MKSRFSIWASRGGTVYIPRGVGMVRDAGTCFWVRVRYIGTCFGYGYGYVLLAPHFGNSTTFPENRYGGHAVPVRRTPVLYTVPPYPTTVPYARTVLPYRTPGPYPRPYPRTVYTRTVPVCRGTYPPYVPVPTPKSYPILGSPATR